MELTTTKKLKLTKAEMDSAIREFIIKKYEDLEIEKPTIFSIKYLNSGKDDLSGQIFECITKVGTRTERL
jgi:hypothetical protein